MDNCSRPPGLRRRSPSLARLLPVLLLTAGCALTFKIPSPLAIKSFPTGSDETIGVYVAAEQKQYVSKGMINVVPYTVEFGNALEPNARYALGKAFRDVVILEAFPPVPDRIRRSVAVEIVGAKVSPGALTFMSSAAMVQLKATLAIHDRVEAEAIMVEGRGEASPGALGAVPVVGIHQRAYDRAVQQACELALRDALEKLVEAVLSRAQVRP